MNKSVFGWSYPPGAANDPSAPWNQQEGPCAICGKMADACICPECPICGAQGDPLCYEARTDSVTWVWTLMNGSNRSRTDSIARAQLRLDYLDAVSREAVAETLPVSDEIQHDMNAESCALNRALLNTRRRHGMTRSPEQIESLRAAEFEWEEQAQRESEAEALAFGLLREGT